MSLPNSKVFVFLAASLMVVSGVAVYFTVSSSFGDNAFTPVQPRINPVTFNPTETIDSTGSPHGSPNTLETTIIGNSS